MTHVSFRVELDEKSSTLETQLPYLGPRERVDADEVLKDDNSHVNHRQVKSDAVVILYDNQRPLNHAPEHSTPTVELIANITLTDYVIK